MSDTTTAPRDKLANLLGIGPVKMRALSAREVGFVHWFCGGPEPEGESAMAMPMTKRTAIPNQGEALLREYEAAKRDERLYGTRFMQNGKRIEPHDMFVPTQRKDART